MSVFTYTEHFFVFFGRQDALSKSYDDVSDTKFKPILFMELLMYRFMNSKTKLNVSLYNKYYYYAVGILYTNPLKYMKLFNPMFI